MALRYTMGKPVKGGPRTKATRELWEAAEQARVMEDHPADCAICGGATDAAMVLEAHRRHLEALTAEWQAQEAARKAAAARYYDGGFRMVLDGAPIRVAAYVKDWAPWMKRALGRRPYKDEAHDIELQMEVLFPAYVPTWEHRKATCTGCRNTVMADYTGKLDKCWRCADAERERAAA